MLSLSYTILLVLGLVGIGWMFLTFVVGMYVAWNCVMRFRAEREPEKLPGLTEAPPIQQVQRTARIIPFPTQRVKYGDRISQNL